MHWMVDRMMSGSKGRQGRALEEKVDAIIGGSSERPSFVRAVLHSKSLTHVSLTSVSIQRVLLGNRHLCFAYSYSMVFWEGREVASQIARS